MSKSYEEIHQEYLNAKKRLNIAIEKTKQENDPQKKEIEFKNVMELAWEENDWFQKINNHLVYSHPREYLLREKCGFSREKEAPHLDSIIEGHRYTVPLFKNREHKW